jgi:cell division protein FtsL
MIDYNLVLYIGITLIVGGGVLFFVAQHYERKAEIELFKIEQKQQQLNESFNKNKLK